MIPWKKRNATVAQIAHADVKRVKNALAKENVSVNMALTVNVDAKKAKNAPVNASVAAIKNKFYTI